MTALRDITANRQIVVDRAVDGRRVRAGGALSRDAAGATRSGRPVALLALVGIGVDARGGPARAVLLLAFPVPFLLFIANTAPASRYLNPVLPFVALFAAWRSSRRWRSTTAGRHRCLWTGVVARGCPGL